MLPQKVMIERVRELCDHDGRVVSDMPWSFPKRCSTSWTGA
jgi:hypothetical protein